MDMTDEEFVYACGKFAELMELIARQLAKAGEPELAAELRAWL